MIRTTLHYNACPMAYNKPHFKKPYPEMFGI